MNLILSIITLFHLSIFNMDKMSLKCEDQTEAQIIDAVAKLPDVRLKNAEIEKKSKAKRYLKIMIYATPQEIQKDYYWVKVAEDNGISLVTHFNFYVYLKNFEVKYYDIGRDKVIDLVMWRKIKKK